MVTENTLENLDKDLAQKPKKKVDWRSSMIVCAICALLVFSFFFGWVGSANSYSERLVSEALSCDSNVLDKNTFVQGLNALYQVNNEEHQIIWQGIQDLNKQLNEIKKGV